MRQVAGTLKLDLAQFRELAAFAQFGSDLDKVTQNQLNRGRRLTEILKQPQFSPLSTPKEILIIYAGTNGFLDDLKVEDIRAFETGLYQYVDSTHADVLKEILEKKALDDNLKKRIEGVLKDYKQGFLAERQPEKVTT
jgi:F-type H+/Na+-transporting ATPase subunit alpha